MRLRAVALVWIVPDTRIERVVAVREAVFAEPEDAETAREEGRRARTIDDVMRQGACAARRSGAARADAVRPPLRDPDASLDSRQYLS